MLTPARSRAAEQAGFTVIELLISVAILGILGAAVVGAMFVGLQTQGAAGARVEESWDVQSVASYLADDTAGAQSLMAGSAPRCGPDATAVLELRGQRFDPATLATTVTVVTYVTRPVTNGSELHRLACESTAASPAYPLTATSDRVLAGRLAASGAASAACRNAAGAGVTCSNAAAATVDLHLSGRSGETTTTLTGHRRTS